MKSVALAHLKGGVGKTTAAVNLAYSAAAAGVKTLLVDLDAQAAATYIMRADGHHAAGAKEIVRAKKSLAESIQGSDFPHLDILPASLSFRKLPQLLDDLKDPKDRLKETVKRVGKSYDLAVIDAPAGLSLESENIAAAADLVLVPLIPTPLAIEGFRTMRRFLGKQKGSGTVRAFFSLVDRRRTLHKRTIEELQARSEVWPVVIPSSSVIERMTLERLPVGAMKRRGDVGEEFERLWELCADYLGIAV
ncbi:MAG: AAA family ATPase [Spirochaetales bacterium]|nr:AAA family ATPase [Spirochaetales bacterium]